MLIDALDTFCSATAASGNGVSNLVGNVRDTHILSVVGPSGTLTDFNTLLSIGSRMLWVVQVQTSYSGGTSVQYQLATDSTANLATSRTNHLDTGAVAVASLVAGAGGGAGAGGYTRAFWLPPDLTYERYMGVWVTTVGATTLGKINSFLTTDTRRWMAFADAI